MGHTVKKSLYNLEVGAESQQDGQCAKKSKNKNQDHENRNKNSLNQKKKRKNLWIKLNNITNEI